VRRKRTDSNALLFVVFDVDISLLLLQKSIDWFSFSPLTCLMYIADFSVCRLGTGSR